MGWIYLPSVSIQNGSNIVTVTNTATDSIKPGDGLLIGSYDLVEIIEVSIGQLKLKKNWSFASQSNAESAVVPTFGDFNAATAALRQATTITQGNFAEMEKWWTQDGLVTFKAYNNTEHTVRTAKQMEQDVSALEVQANALIAEIAGAGYARSESDMIADRERNNQLYAASGPIHTGKHWDNGTPNIAINQGLYTVLSTKNTFLMGRGPSDTSVSGSSPTNHPVFNIADVTLDIIGMNSAASGGRNVFKLPEVPKGSEVYDSATGVLTNFETEIDPKYGDVAADVNEAVARAFGGDIYNADFRLDGAGWQLPTSNSTVDFSGRGALVTRHTSDGKVCQLLSAIYDHQQGQEYTISFYLDETNVEVKVLCQYSTVSLHKSAKIGWNKFKFTSNDAAGLTVGINIISDDVGAYARVSDFSCMASTKEVVTHPVDLAGLELFLRPINEADPFAYPYSMQQSKLTSVDGIPTVENNVRPITHFEVYPGDTTSRGRGWNLLDGSLSDAQQAKIFQNPEHNIYRMSDGTLVQWTVSQRTIRGAGNGDWANVNPSDTSLMFSTGKLFVQARGVNDSASPLVLAGSSARYVAPNNSGNVLGGISEKGVFVPTTSVAYNGECYFYVIGTVPRLNQFGYHPSINPYGTGTFSDGLTWDKTNDSILTLRDCVINATNGDIASGISGYPDGLYHDVIYDGGLNGLIDWRTPARDSSSPTTAAKIRQKVFSGNYRGLEKLVKTTVLMPSDLGIPINQITKNSDAIVESDAASGVYSYRLRFEIAATTASVTEIWGYRTLTLPKALRRVVYVGDNGNYFISYGIRHTAYTGSRHYFSPLSADGAAEAANFNAAFPNGTVLTIYAIDVEDVGISVSGISHRADVLGSPVNIYQSKDLSRGWLGGWIDGIPDGVKGWLDFRFIRDRIDVNSRRIWTDSNGESWGSVTTTGLDAVKNSFNSSSVVPVTRVEIWPYSFRANPLKPSINQPVLNARAGIGSMIVTNGYYQDSYLASLMNGLIGKVGVSDAAENFYGEYTVNSIAIRPDLGVIDGGNGRQPTHNPIDNLQAPTNSATGVKALAYQISNNQQCSLAFAFNEIAHNGENWGDNASLKIDDGLATYTNLNDELLLCGCSELSIPYGYSKNTAGAGDQLLGVDF
ncbi:hypothetical protein [Vibrio furnissii]|uniref:hypothetical protein n=1 Tax=Vibrio furnissii TaxID=29494 RepID=UPI001EEC4C1B|nr:hypothetical protein [Vibrio furnissii]